MLRLELLPAGCGDCLWLEYGRPGETHIVLIDGGVEDTAGRLEARIQDAIKERQTTSLHIDLLVVTHIDNDHILGILKLLEEARLPLSFGDIWFNGNHQLPNCRRQPKMNDAGTCWAVKTSPYSDLTSSASRKATVYTRLLSDASRRLPWNRAFEGKAVTLINSGALPVIDLAGTKTDPPGSTAEKTSSSIRRLAEGSGRLRAGSARDCRHPGSILGRRDTWPPIWRDEEKFDEADGQWVEAYPPA